MTVLQEDKGRRLDAFVPEKLEAVSRTKVHHYIESGGIVVNGCTKKPSYRLKEGDTITITINEEKKEVLKPYDFPVKIIYEDDDILVVDKPTGLVVHPPQDGFDKTLVNALIFLRKELSTVNPKRAGVVHRLDKETSGVMVLAKNNYSHLNLVEQFRSRSVKKEYMAVVWGRVEKENIVVDMPLGRDEKNRLRMRVSFSGARPAYTEISVGKRFDDTTLLVVKPLTGRMHQIRVHLKFLGFPIVGDKKYGIKDPYKDLFLHSRKLSIYHPRSGEQLSFSACVPERFERFIKERDVHDTTFGRG